jgi:hypothetical protein
MPGKPSEPGTTPPDTAASAMFARYLAAPSIPAAIWLAGSGFGLLGRHRTRPARLGG